ncbi:MAG: hypothetical protein GX382_09060 [Syntrophomonadaceae bacterium]|jgi:hypothetical protein|nr:hypothetical protein [Bacillota bacterium]NLP24651.1 hypothetical protein [Syntrophomonadaceae bacterium]
MSFSEISIYQVKPDKTDEFEAIMKDAVQMMKAIDGCQFLRLIQRTHYIKDIKTIKDGLPPDKLTRIVKCVRYVLYWEFDTDTSYGKAQKQLYETHWKAIEKCLIVPHDKILGEVII